MVIINNVEYTECDIDITWQSFTVSNNSKKRSGVAPFITFKVNNILIGLEFTITKDILRESKINEVNNINKYLSDITFEDNKGWGSLILGKYDCNITRKDDKNFNLDFYVQEDETSIYINTNIELL